MLFGTPESFAVEIWNEPQGARWSGFGRMSLLVGGMRLGDPEEEHCSLFHAVERIAEVARSLPELWDERFSGVDAQSIFAFLDRALYLSDEAYDESLKRFDFLTNTGETFDQEKSFVYCEPDGRVHVLLQRLDLPVQAAACDAATFRHVATDLAVWFHGQVQQHPVQ